MLWSLALLFTGISISFLAKDSFQRFFSGLLIITAALGIALDNLNLSWASWSIGLLGYIVLHLFAIALSPLQIFLKITKPQPTAATGIVVHHPGPKDVAETISMDIVAVHGLGSNPEWAWMHEASGVMWLKDLLPVSVPRARIMAFNHNSAWKTNAPTKSVEDCGRELLSVLSTHRESPEAKERPIIFIGHSFGGIIIKKALDIASREAKDDRYNSLGKAMLGAIFLGVPHDGSRIQPFGVLLSYGTYWLGSSAELLEALEPGAKSLRELNDWFITCYGIERVVNFYETLNSVAFGIPLLLAVDPHSSNIPGGTKIPLDRDHIGMNKFPSATDTAYMLVVKEIRRMEMGSTRFVEDPKGAWPTRF